MKNEHGERFYHIDFLKGICIIFVIITHCNWEDTEKLKLLFPFYIDMAVPVFMIISGYMYAVSYKKNNINSIGDAYLAKNIINKILRFTIPFSIIFITEQIVYFLQNGQQYSKSILDFIHLFLIGGTGPGSYYYPVMIQFIFVYPVIFFYYKKA